MPAQREDPYGNFNFVVMIDGRTQAAFSEVSGLGVEIVPIEYRTGADRLSRFRKIPGLQKFTNVTLKRGVTGDRALWDWLKATADGEDTAANVMIQLLDQKREPVMAWGLSSAWPCRWSGPTLDGRTNQIAIEILELCHEGLSLE